MLDDIVIITACWTYIGFTIYGWIQDYREKKRLQEWQRGYDELVKSFGPSTYKGFIPWPLTSGTRVNKDVQ